jgi:hypothetical protein
LGGPGFRFALLQKLSFERLVSRKNRLLIEFIVANPPSNARIIAANRIKQRIDITFRRNARSHPVQV